MASYTEKNMIIEEPNEDEDQNECRKKPKQNIVQTQNPHLTKQTKS